MPRTKIPSLGRTIKLPRHAAVTINDSSVYCHIEIGKHSVCFSMSHEAYHDLNNGADVKVELTRDRRNEKRGWVRKNKTEK